MSLLKFCATETVKKFAFVSSYSTCTGTRMGTPVDEISVSLDPNSCFKMGYAQSKYIGVSLLGPF